MILKSAILPYHNASVGAKPAMKRLRFYHRLASTATHYFDGNPHRNGGQEKANF